MKKSELELLNSDSELLTSDYCLLTPVNHGA